MGHREEVLGFLGKIAPRAASNAKIVSHTHIKPHQQVFQITKGLMDEGLISGRRVGREWHFSGGKTSTAVSKKGAPIHSESKHPTGQKLTPSKFEQLCRQVMSEELGAVFSAGKVQGVHKQFDLVSDDGQIVGDAKYYTAVRGTGLPPAKFSTIAEYVWLLEKTRAIKQFLVFGNDRRVPEWWLDRYGNLTDVQFYYVSDTGAIAPLNETAMLGASGC